MSYLPCQPRVVPGPSRLGLPASAPWLILPNLDSPWATPGLRPYPCENAFAPAQRFTHRKSDQFRAGSRARKILRSGLRSLPLGLGPLALGGGSARPVAAWPRSGARPALPGCPPATPLGPQGPALAPGVTRARPHPVAGLERPSRASRKTRVIPRTWNPRGPATRLLPVFPFDSEGLKALARVLQQKWGRQVRRGSQHLEGGRNDNP